MKKTIRLLVIIFSLHISSMNISVMADGFIAGFNDIPAMDGLIVADAPNIEFDSAEGRFVEVQATSLSINKDQISNFYRQALPPLGWERSTDNIYIRDGEKFTIDFINGDNKLIIYFILAPK